MKKKKGDIPHIYKNSSIAKLYKFFEFQKNGFNTLKKRKSSYLYKINNLLILYKYVLKKYRVSTESYTNSNRKRKVVLNKKNYKRVYRRKKFNKNYLFLLKKQEIIISLP